MAKYKTSYKRGGKNVFVYRDSKGRFVKFDPEEVYETTRQTYIDMLTELGNDAIHYAYEHGNTSAPKERDEDGRVVGDGKWRNRTYNLHDSFGSAVFDGGYVVPESIRFLGEELSEKGDKLTKQKGREALLEYFYNASYGAAKNEIVLVCMAAMYYTKYLEAGTHRGGYEIRVISYATDYIREHWYAYTGKAKYIVLKGLKLPSWV